VVNFSPFVPDALTTTDNDGTGNTIAARAQLLTDLGFTELPNGAPLVLPSDFNNTNTGLLRAALIPDVLRLDLDLPPGELAVGAFGYQNGRTPQVDVTDIIFLLVRQLADVKFPDGSGVPGSGPLGDRFALDCDGDPSPFPQCDDRRVLAVLQGTDWIKPDDQIADLTISGNEREFPSESDTATASGTTMFADSVFPFFPNPHPLPGEPGTVGFPQQDETTPTPTPTNGNGNGDDDGGGCSIASGSVTAGQAAASVLIPLIPAFAIGFRMLRRRNRKEEK
jgi:hypothetical protein